MAEQLYAFTQDVPISFEVYQRIAEKLEGRPIPGSLLHLCVRREDGGLRYIDVWESEAACARAFEEHIHPVVREVLAQDGGAMPPEPTVQPLDVLHAMGPALGQPVR